MTFFGNIVYLRHRSVICSARAANDTTRAQINNIPEKSHVIPLITNSQNCNMYDHDKIIHEYTVRSTCKSFLSCDSCLPFVLEFYNGTALEVSVSTHFIFNKKRKRSPLP